MAKTSNTTPVKPNLKQKLSLWDTMYVWVGGWKMEVRLLPPQQSSDKSISVTVRCMLWMDLPTVNLPPPAPIREEDQAHYSGQLANGLGVPCCYSRLIWSQSDDGAMSTQAACHSGGLTHTGQREVASLRSAQSGTLIPWVCQCVYALITTFFITDATTNRRVM